MEQEIKFLGCPISISRIESSDTSSANTSCKEILDGNYQSITSVPQSDGMAFLLGGRNEVLLYSFQQ